MVGGHAHFILQFKVIYFYHHAINFIGKVISFFFKILTVIYHCLYALEYFFFFFRTPESQFPKHLKDSRVGGKRLWKDFTGGW